MTDSKTESKNGQVAWKQSSEYSKNLQRNSFFCLFFFFGTKKKKTIILFLGSDTGKFLYTSQDQVTLEI